MMRNLQKIKGMKGMRIGWIYEKIKIIEEMKRIRGKLKMN